MLHVQKTKSHKEQKEATTRIFVVVPTIRQESILRFLDEWKDIFKKNEVVLVVVEDNPVKAFGIDDKKLDFNVLHLSWADIENDLGLDNWIIPRRSSSIKSYGFWKAYQLGADMIISLDDDCYPSLNYSAHLKAHHIYDLVETHRHNLFERKFREPAWVSSTLNLNPRGFPHKNFEHPLGSERVMLSHGLWANVPDVDAETQINMKEIPHIDHYFHDRMIPRWSFFPMCGMNVAWKRELTPAMYFLLMGKNAAGELWGYDRFDDIWAGVFAKKIIDVLDYRAASGHPVVWHDRASDPYVNLEKERSGLEINENLWQIVYEMNLSGTNVKDLYKEISSKLPHPGEYWNKIRRAMVIWADLF
ncbi:MAG: hypothetical protein AAB432_00615 [Patescibacteria group bacterium]